MTDPWLSEPKSYAPTSSSLEANKDPAWSADTQEIDNPNHRRSSSSGRGTQRGGNKEEDEYELLHGTETYEGHHPGRQWADEGEYSGAAHHVDTSYQGAHSYEAPSALSPDGYHSESPGLGRPSPVEFPSAPHGYDAHSGGGGYGR
jgi:hypothetical protein